MQNLLNLFAAFAVVFGGTLFALLQIDSPPDQLPPQVKKTKVAVANQNILNGTDLKREHVKIIEMPADEASDSIGPLCFYDKFDFERGYGNWTHTLRHIRAGEIISREDFGFSTGEHWPQGFRHLPLKLPKRDQAFEEVIALQNGKVDIIATDPQTQSWETVCCNVYVTRIWGKDSDGFHNKPFDQAGALLYSIGMFKEDEKAFKAAQAKGLELSISKVH